MIRARLFSIMFCFVLTAITVSGQQLFYRSNHLDQLIKNGAEKPGSNDIPRIIRIIAQGDGRQNAAVQYTVSLDQSLLIFRENPKTILIRIEHNGIKLLNPVLVRGFDVTNFLTPTAVEVAYRLQRQGSLPVDYRASKKISGTSADNIETRIADSATVNGCNLQITEFYLAYNENDIHELEDRVNLIREYYSYELLLNQAYDRLMRINPQDVLSLDMQNANLLEVEKFIQDTRSKKFDNTLDLYAYDPIEMKKKLKQLEEEAASRRVVMNQTKANLYLYFYNSGLDLKSRGRNQQAYDAFMISIRENPIFAPAMYQLALMDFYEGRFGESECRARTILEELRPDPDIERMTQNLLARLSQTYTQLGEEKLSAGKLDNALDYLKRAFNLCTTMPGVACDDKLSKDLSTAHGTKYKQFLDQAKQLYQQSDLDGAERIISLAVAYQQANRKFILSSADAVEMRKAIKQKRYGLMVDDAVKLQSDGNDEGAVNRLMQAAALLQQEGLNVDSRYNSILRESGKRLFIQKAKSAKQSARDNNLKQARLQISELSDLLKKYMLEQDTDCLGALNDARNMVFSQECANAQAVLDGYAGKAGIAFDQRDFIATDDLIAQALNVSVANKDCHLSEGNLNATRDSIRMAVNYQRMIVEVLRLQSSGRLPEALDQYEKAGSYFISSNVARFGLHHDDVDSFAYSRCSVNFLDFLGNVYIDRGQYDHSLSVYRNVLTRNGGKCTSGMKKSLVRLGMEIAVRDKRSGAFASWKSGALHYTNGDKRLKPLEKGYRKGWKKD